MTQHALFFEFVVTDSNASAPHDGVLLLDVMERSITSNSHYIMPFGFHLVNVKALMVVPQAESPRASGSA